MDEFGRKMMKEFVRKISGQKKAGKNSISSQKGAVKDFSGLLSSQKP